MKAREWQDVTATFIKDPVPIMSNPSLPEPLRQWLEMLREAQAVARASGFQTTPASVRDALASLTRRFVTHAPTPGLIRDARIQTTDHEIQVRIYHPNPNRAPNVALFVHGGGHMGGSVEVYDPIARKLTETSGRVLVSVDYALAPEHPYPAGFEDVRTCAASVFDLLETERLPHTRALATIGDSAGGALCAQLAHLAPELDIERQVLVYPSLDYRLTQPSADTFADGYLLERERILWMFDAYFQHAENRQRLSPIEMAVPPTYPKTLILTAECDPLRDEGLLYHRRLLDQGIQSTHMALAGSIHAFLNLEDLLPEVCAQSYAVIGEFLSI